MKTRQMCERYVRSMGIAITVGVLLCTGAFAAQCPEGMLSYWKFDDETAADRVGTNDGIIYGATPTSGIVGKALSFDGVDDYVLTRNSAAVLGLTGNSPRTVMAWAKLRSRPADQAMIVGWGIHAPCDLMSGLSFQAHWSIIPPDRLPILWFWGGCWSDVRGSSIGAYDRWYHVAFTYDGSTLILYRDGVEDGRGSFQLRTPDTPITIGVFPDGSMPFLGTLDEVAIYNRALTADEIRRHYEAGLAGKGYCEATPQDTTPPTISCPSNVTLAADPQKCTASNVGLGLPDASDDSGQVSVGNNAPTEFPVGQTVVTWTATDPSGNSASCSQTVTVLPRLRVMFVSPLEDDNVDDDIGTDADAANRFKVGSTVPHKVRLVDCNGNEVTASVASLVSVKLNVTLRDAGNSSYVVDLPESYTGAGGPGGLMVLSEGSFQYNLKTTGYESGTVNSSRYFRSHVTVSYNSNPTIIVGEEDATLESR